MMKKLMKILSGLILLGGLAFTIPGMPLESWGNAAIELIKGGATFLVALIGLALVVMGFNELKE